MKVLIWKAHGDTQVYDVSTPEKLKARIDEVIVSIEGWDLDDKIQLVEGHMTKHPDDWKELNKAFNTIKNAVAPGSHEMFEDFYITDLK